MIENNFTVKNKLKDPINFKISRFKEVIKRTKPHKHDDYFEIIYLLEGEGFHQIESEQFKISTPEFYILKPGQLHYWQFTSVPKGFVVMLRLTFFDKFKEAETINLIRQLFEISQVSIPKDYSPTPILEEIYSEYLNGETLSIQLVKTYLKALILKVIQLANLHSSSTSLNSSLFNKFNLLLTKELPRIIRVKDFAKELGTTPQNLNAVCRKQVGKSASELINSQLMLEAKRYILHTDMTISEIAYKLLFNDPSYFVKFFKKWEKITPAEFRKKHFH